MPAIYVTMAGYTVVFTPHFNNQFDSRVKLHEGAKLDNCFVGSLWSQSPENQIVAVAFGAGYIYSRKAFNSWRNRWELELISFTPNKHIQTLNNKSARLLALR
jgi:hypothetical protein